MLGAGLVGLLGATTFVAAGFDAYVYSRQPEASDKGALVKSFGAQYLSAETHTVAQLAEEIGSIDLVYEAVGPEPCLNRLSLNG